MATQNLISAELTAEKKANVLKAIADIKTNLDFLLTLQPDERMGLFKAAYGFAPMLDLAYQTVLEHPEIMPRVFDIEEFKRDYLLSKELTTVANPLEQLNDGTQNTLMAVNSDTLKGALEVYAAVKQNLDKIPGLQVVAQKMAEFFQKTPPKTTQPVK